MDPVFSELSVLLVGAAVLGCLAVIGRQPIIIAYVLAGMLIGPWGLGWLSSIEFIEKTGHLGITLLLFLAGLCLHPQKLLGLFRKTLLITVINALFAFAVIFFATWVLRFSLGDCLWIGLALMFSSTILVVKLLPTTKLHQQRMGAICISVLILQDLMAVALLLWVGSASFSQGILLGFAMLIFKIAALSAGLILFDTYILHPVMKQVDRIHEALFILGLAWCFGIAAGASHIGLSYEIGAFLAGVALARRKISFFISERLKPLRDFFLVIFFFSLGAGFDMRSLGGIFLPALLLSVMLIVVKALGFKLAFQRSGEPEGSAKELGVRLAQGSEFSLLLALSAANVGFLSQPASLLVKAVTILTFIFSSYIVVWRFPTPIGTSEKLFRD